MDQFRILIANRGEISCRIIRTCKKIGIKSYAIYTKEDELSLHVQEADFAIKLPSGPLSQNYMNIDFIIQESIKHKIDAIHPGYGFLSENLEFCEKVINAGIIWIGPTKENISIFSSKHISKEIAVNAKVPILPSSNLVKHLNEAIDSAEKLGYPVMIKCSDAGGGIGMFKCTNQAEIEENFPLAQQKSLSFFKSDAIYLEKFLTKAHHIEVQIFGDGAGNCYAIGERECSAQRRNQKVIEESPSPYIDNKTREKMICAAIRLGQLVNYKSVGTFEFIIDHDTKNFYFLEANTRLQVEHPITEFTYQIDLVEQMIQLAIDYDNMDWSIFKNCIEKGWSIEARIYAENPLKNFQPSCGKIVYADFPKTNPNELRIDTFIQNNIDICPFYDPVLAKVISFADSREKALDILKEALENTLIQGVDTNIEFLINLLNDELMKKGEITTSFLDTFEYVSYSLEVLDAGFQSSIQDYPGRIGYWNVGIPPSGPMDNLNFQIANILIGNNPYDAGIEILMTNFSCSFKCDSIISVTGAECEILVNGEKKEMYEAIRIFKDDIVSIGLNNSCGCRCYLAVFGGIRVKEFLGSKSTFINANIGGYNGQALSSGQFLSLTKQPVPIFKEKKFKKEIYFENFSNFWVIKAMIGPHGSPDYFTDDDIRLILDSEYIVGHNSNRLGLRLSALDNKLKFARDNGGDAGLHPSNVHDYAYGIGSINMSGCTPVIIAVDGPSLGGFVCPLTIIRSELWKIGQMRPGDRVKFEPACYQYAFESFNEQIKMLKSFENEENFDFKKIKLKKDLCFNPIFGKVENIEGIPAINFRFVGDSYVLVELVIEKFEILNRIIVEYLMNELKKSFEINYVNSQSGVEELCPGVSSLLIKYEMRTITHFDIYETVKVILSNMKSLDDFTINCRKVHMPLSFRDRWSLAAIDRYSKTIKSKTPFLPDNCDFICKVNEIENRETLAKLITDATYLVLGLGDVYLGAPCAVPLDPRHRIVTTKYDPARTFTPEGAVGIGGIYLCAFMAWNQLVVIN